MNFDTLMPLEMMCQGEWGEVAEVAGRPEHVSRLAELGVRTGSRVQVLQSGRPCLLRVGGGRLSIRGDMDLQIMVRPSRNLAAVSTL